MSSYTKTAAAKATVGEARQLAFSASHPATVAARFAIILALIACVASAAAIAIAVAK